MIPLQRPRKRQPKGAATSASDFFWSFLWSAANPTVNAAGSKSQTPAVGTAATGPGGVWRNMQSSGALQAFTTQLPTNRYTAVMVWVPQQASTVNRSLLRTTGGAFRIECETTIGGVYSHVTHTGVAAATSTIHAVGAFDARPWVTVARYDGTTCFQDTISPDGGVQSSTATVGIIAGTGTVDISTTSGSLGAYMLAMSPVCASQSFAAKLLRRPWCAFAARRIWVPVSAGVGATDLTVAEASHGHSADSLTLSIGVSLAINDATHGHAADAVALTTASTLAVADATHAHAADQLTLSLAGSELLTIADANHAHSADALTLSTEWLLAVAEALHAHAADSLTLSVAGADTLAIADSAHAHTADALALTSASSLAIADASHAHTVDGLTLTAQSVIAIQEALHAHAADNITLSADNSTPLLIAEALHAHTSDGLALTVDAWLVIADALHAHTADAITLGDSGAVVLVVADSVHAHAADNILLSIPGAFRAGNPRVWILDSRQRYSLVDSRRRVVHLN